MASTAMKVFSLVQAVSEGNADAGTIASAFDLFSGLVGSASSLAPSSAPAPVKAKPPPSNPDRIDTAAAASTSELDEAIGTLMVYGGQYLRKLAVWGYEYATAVPTDLPVEDSVSSSSSQSVSVVKPSTSTSSVVKKKGSPLQTLKPEELEKLGLKAVAAGASPQKLQQAFASAQISGDWSSLEKLIVGALGADALPATPAPPSIIDLVVNGGSSGGSTSSVSTASSPGGGILSTITNTLSGFIGGSSGVDKVGQAAPTRPGAPTTSSAVPQGGMAYYAAVAEQFMDKMDRVVNGIPEGEEKPANAGPIEVNNDSIVTRFINEFDLQKEAFALQMQVNSAINTINKYIGDDQENAVNKIGVAAGAGSGSSGGSGGPDVTHSQVNTGILATLMSVPSMVGNTVAAAFKFLSPASATASAKVDNVPGSDAGNAPSSAFNVAEYATPLNTVALGALGSAALGSVLWSAYVTELEEKKKRRRLDLQEYPYYQDDVPDDLGSLDYTNYDYASLQDLDYYEQQQPAQFTEQVQQFIGQPDQLAGYPGYPQQDQGNQQYEQQENEYDQQQNQYGQQQNQYDQQQHWVSKRSAQLRNRKFV